MAGRPNLSARPCKKAPARAGALILSRLVRRVSPEIRHDVPVDAKLELVDVLRVLKAHRRGDTESGVREDGAVDSYCLVA